MDAHLFEHLKSPDAGTRAAAAEALCHLGSEARDAAVALAQATADSNESVVEWASATLEDLGPPPASAVAELAALVIDEQAGPAYWAATLLGRLGPAAKAATPALSQALAGPWPEVRKRAAWALEKIAAD
jgi:HEAT repeat protein